MNINGSESALAAVTSAMLHARPELALLAALVGRFDAAIGRLDAIEAKLAAPIPHAADVQRTGIKAKETAARLEAVGIKPALGPDDWKPIVGRSRREVDRLRSEGKIPKPDFYSGRSPRWHAATAQAWLASQGGKK